jgi:O-antigen/teichoic acid export membrane protein
VKPSKLESRAAVWAAIGQVVVVTAAVCRAVILARALNPADLGRFFLMLSAAALAGLGATGFAIAGLRRVAASEDAGHASQTVRSVAQLTLAMNALVLATTAAVTGFARISSVEALALAAFMTTVLWMGVLSALARGLGHVTSAIQQEQVVAPMAQLLGLVWCVMMSRDGVSVAFLMAVQAVCAWPSLALLARRVAMAAPRDRRPVTATLRRAVLSESLPILLNTIVWRVFIDLPLWTAGLVIGTGGSALFGVAQRLASVLQLPFAAVSSILAPEAAALAARRQYAELEGRLRRGANLAALGAAAGFALVIIAGRPLLGIVYGPYFERAAPAVIVLALAQLVNSTAGLGGVTLQMLNESRRLLVLSAIATAALGAIIWPLARAFGVTGLAWAWLAAVVLQNALMIAAVRRLTGMRVYAGRQS